MSSVTVRFISPEAANRGIAELWCGPEMMGETVVDHGRLQLRINARPGGGPWMVETASLARALSDASRR